MEFNFRYSLTDSEKNRLANWYSVQGEVAIEQHPGWPEVTAATHNVCFFYATKNDEVVCSAVIEERTKIKVRTAEIAFGPLFKDSEAAVSCLDQIYLYYEKKGFALLTIQLGKDVNPETEYIEYSLSKIRQFKTYLDRNNWSSIRIDLSKGEDELLRSMSKGHKSDIKKAQKEGLTVLHNFTEQQFADFVDVYSKMHLERGLTEHSQGSSVFLHKVLNFLNQFKAGSFLLVIDKNKKVIGGIVVVFQNKSVRYFKGAADPEVRNLPVLHLAIWEAIKTYKGEGFNYFDLWGYNHFVTESDQIFFINRFKKGFGGSFTFYPKKIYFIIRPLRYKLLVHTKKIYKKLTTHVRIRRHH